MEDALGQEIRNGDFVVSGQRDGNSGKLGMGVVKDASRHTRVSLQLSHLAPNDFSIGKIGRLGDFSQSLKIPDKMLIKIDAKLFERANDIREQLGFSVNRQLIHNVNLKQELQSILESKI